MTLTKKDYLFIMGILCERIEVSKSDKDIVEIRDIILKLKELIMGQEDDGGYFI